ncbi:MAG: UDP-N-acetylglucosamine 1-carboxyvinyltransferase [Clostridia bacterium]|nr:UDP-N-acetylglucosamine 1-carboxyvinyltransferase [Clostridia bacterium]
MNSFEIIGGNRLTGELEIDTSKNATLPIIAGSILSDETVVIKNIPMISDALKMLDILKQMGSSVVLEGNNAIINNSSLEHFEIPKELESEIRSSIFMLGPLLARHKKARVAYPGGCDIGSRPIDLHLSGLKSLGVKVEETHGYINCETERMKCGIVHLDFPSVGATENIMMASVLSKGRTTILNAAREPEIVDLARFINSMGGKIYGAGTSTIEIQGVKKLHGTEFRPMSDRIVAGTFMIGTAMTKGKVRLTNCNSEHVYSLITKLHNSGCKVEVNSDNIYIECNKRPTSCQSIETQPYPGFPTDLQAQMVALETISSGTSIVTENLFETRFKHVPELAKMGANVWVKGRMVFIVGKRNLHGAEVSAGDLRGGAALVLAGLAARGTTIVSNAHFVDRGYENLDEKLLALGANIKRS